MGAVYDVQFSPEGKTIASGSFDKTVRVWSSIAPYKEIYCLKDHTLNVSDLCWSKDSAELLSGGYDHTCKLWGMENGKLISSYVTNGFVQCVMLDDEDPNIFYAGTSRNDFLVFDIRAQRNVKSIACSSMVNSMTLCNRYLITAHASGTMIVWDMRNDKKITSHLNEATQNAISDINLCKSYLNNYKNSPQYISVNSFDNVLRIYLLNNTEFQLTHALKGHKNKNWPIKSSFRNYSLDQSKNFEREISLDENEGETNLIQLSEHAYVATGSSDSYVYIYNVELPEGPSDFVQKLEGHTDKVYAVDMHPMEPTLCSSSADFTLKIWSAIKARK